jgi:hypothetical protein
MQENHGFLVNSTNLSLACQWELDIFPVNISTPTGILYGSRVEWSI